jgi:hypothetical protein
MLRCFVITAVVVLIHRYLRGVDFSRRISLQKIHFSKKALVANTNKAGRLTRQAGWVIICTLFNSHYKTRQAG